jgi:hypothetical protein
MAKQHDNHSKTGPKFSASLDHLKLKKYFLVCIQWSSLANHLKTRHFCVVFEWLNKMATIQKLDQNFQLA